MDPAPTQYIDRDGAAMAFQVIGEGPHDVVSFYEAFQHLDLSMTDPDINHNVERIAAYARSVYFQRRGFGLSDQVSYVPTLEQQADDVLAIMDAVGMRRATLVGWVTTCSAMALVAARSPDRVNALILIHPMAQGPESSGDLHGWTDDERHNLIEGFQHVVANWGSGALVDLLGPAMDTAFNRRLMAVLERSSTTPAAIRSYYEWVLQQDTQDVFRAIQAPTSVLCIPGVAVPEAVVRYAAEVIPGSTYLLMPPYPRGTSIGQIALPMTDLLEEVVTGAPHTNDVDRFLGTVLFTDVVSSTELLERVGDAAYRQMRADHERAVRLAVETAGGRLMTVTGDGTLSVFDSPTKAVRCAETICRDAEDAGISVRAGIHTGELEHAAMNVTGLTVHIGARVGAAAEPGQVLVSRTVHDLVAGSGLTFASRGEHELKGVSGRWELFAVTHAGEQPQDLPQEESMQTSMDKMALQTARRAPRFARAAVRLGHALERRRARIG
jgi:class 3 adenylate cyclase